MTRLDEIAPNFRRAVMRWPEANHLAAHHRNLAIAMDGNAIGVLDYAKSFLESVCRTILKDAGEFIDANPEPVWLFSRALETVGLGNEKGKSRVFNKLLSAQRDLVVALTQVRDSDGAISHGKDGFLDEFSRHSLRICILSVDSALALLLGGLERTDPDLRHTRLPFRNFEHHHRKIDEAVDCRAEVEGEGDKAGQMVALTFTVPGTDVETPIVVRPSELLFSLDRNAYIEILRAAENARPIQEDQE